VAGILPAVAGGILPPGWKPVSTAGSKLLTPWKSAEPILIPAANQTARNRFIFNGHTPPMVSGMSRAAHKGAGSQQYREAVA